ncbi:acetyl-CoA carboxylase, carboxyltransferase subunit beta [Dictyobacter arantiisoli]|uniref:Acetyl-coenzyme A carboxylase carboxyl transferase subunit beta n=1 Tax=Dictyobacter arantiisoli TaxID=2014874 RepID=A0A5A5TG32_9CHLR|nr:acetyl-CoA carboxylase, carboxyltransferase subunit beta [Dictyobacter arantiisoli]GCF10116.1 acetyl-coenzyme A carboxylase carboxyl transferase subunit beta [Dictyobacter arantiisoli]
MAKEAAVPLTRQVASHGEEKPARPSVGNIAVKCPKCKEILYNRDVEKNLKVCSRCNYHFRLTAYERIDLLADPGSFTEMDTDIISIDPLQFTAFPPSYSDQRTYTDKLTAEREKTGLKEGVITGHATIETKPLTLAIMDFHFMGGSMGSAVGEKITRAIESAITHQTPMFITTTSGGARMQEGLFSLMQLAKISAALAKLGEAHLPYIVLLTDPTTGGVSASFAMQGDITIAEPGALICFTGPRVIEQFMHIKLPEGTVNSEFALQHGMIDAITHRRDLRQTLGRILRLYA